MYQYLWCVIVYKSGLGLKLVYVNTPQPILSYLGLPLKIGQDLAPDFY